MTTPKPRLVITAEKFPNLSQQQIETLNALQLPRYLYRGAADISQFPMRSISNDFEAFLMSSRDYSTLPPAPPDGKRDLLYLGDAETASGYANILHHTVFITNPNGSQRQVSADTLTFDELYKILGNGEDPKTFAGYHKRLYRIDMEDILKRLPPDGRIIHDDGQRGVSWAVVGKLTSAVPAVHIRRVDGWDSNGEHLGYKFVDTQSGRTTTFGFGYDRVETLEPEASDRSRERVANAIKTINPRGGR